MARTAQKETGIFEQMPIRRAVLTLAVPTVISQLIVMVYNLADTWFIGQTGDPYQAAAVTVTYPLFMLLSAFANLFGIGGSSLISRLLGLANLVWPLYGLMLVQPFMECTGSLIALLLYRKERKGIMERKAL